MSVYIYGCRLVRSLYDREINLAHEPDALAKAAELPMFLSAMEGGRSCPRPPLDKLLETVMDQTADASSWNAVLWMVNAEHEADLRQFDRVRAFAAARRVTVFAIKYLQDASHVPASLHSGSDTVNRLVSAIGGTTLHAEFGELGSVSATVIADIRQRYIVSFPRPGNGRAGAHWIEISSTAKGVKILSAAASAPLVEARCGSGRDSWLCSQRRPQYGNQRP